MSSSVRRRRQAVGGLVVLVLVLQALGYRIVGGVVDLVTLSLWTWVATLLLIGFVLGRRIERALNRRDIRRSGLHA